MKLHLPLNLYRALLLALCAVPALLHADNDELITTNYNTENEQITGYTNINGDIQYTDSFIRENSGKYDYLDIDTLIFEGVTDILFYNNNGWFDGGAFGCDKGNASFINNGDISFKENVAEWNGGAIENSRDSTITFCDNGNINFEKNSVSNNDARNGGAITNESNSSISLSGNGEITFVGNSVTGDAIIRGGAISNGSNSSISLRDNENISFDGNSITGIDIIEGGAICNNSSSSISLSGNENITFKGNRATGDSIIRGGAIFNEDDSSITLSNNANIIFEGNSAKTTGVEISGADGGAIYNTDTSFISFNNNGNINFVGNSVEEGSLADYDFDENTTYGRSSGAEGGAIYNTFTSSVTFSCNKNISFEGNKTTGFYANSGAIYNYRESTITFDNNGDISFVKNSATDFGTTYPLSETASTEGGAIYNASESTITFDNNANISFVGNSTTSIGKEGAHAKGGAIYNFNKSTITFDNNANISFVGNSTTSIGKEGAHAKGGAIYNFSKSTITFDNNGDISFEKNSVTNQGEGGDYSDAYGGAIYNYSESSITFDNNANISFTGNTVTHIGGERSVAYGGAIYNYSNSTITFDNNGDISFEKNSVTNQGEGGDYSEAYGGAIYNDSIITFNNNANISFTGNTVTHIGGEYSDAYGGAIYNDSIITFSNNGNIFFEDNSATSNCEVSGGAIYNWDDLSLIGNKDITFHGNSVTGTGEDSAQGGAIYNWGDLSLIGNKDITFQGNCVTGTGEDSAQGGAIYHRTGNFILRDNGNVLFEKNIEKSGNSYRLRSIYSGGNLILGAANDKKIEFRDSIYSNSTTSFNAAYTDESGNSIKQTGDIIFTGAYTEAHLKEAKGGIAGTADEILASRTSELTGTTTLYGGRLRIEDGAILKGRTLDVADNANATVLLRQGTLDLGSYSLNISANSTLSAIGENTINARNVIIKEGGALQLALDFAQLDSAAVLTTTGNLNMGNIAFDLTGTEYLVAGDYKLLTRTEGFTYDISGWTLNGVTADKLRWENGTLYYTGGHDWNHGVTDDDDISDLEEILGNLIINGGDVTLEVVVQAIQDAVDAGFGHGKGHIVINRGGIHISGAGDLDGHIIFNGDLKYIRKLFIEKDITNIKIELGGSSAAQNIVDVGGEYTMEIDELSGDGSMSKTGEGEMVIHGKGHKVGGTLDVQEGSLTFSVGNGATDNEAETEINELVVGNKEDKNAKVKVDKDTKVKGNKLHLDGKNAVVTNEGTMEFSGEVKVEEGHLDNQGSISKVTLEGGTVSGSGTFDGLEMNGGELIVGNSPGLQLFTDVVALNEGMVVFSLSDASLAATADTHGWDSASYSTMDLGGNALTLGEDVNFVLEIGGHALESLVAMDGATLTFSLNLIQNIDSGSLTLDEEAFAILLDNTKIVITADSEGLFDEAMQLAGMDITEMLSNATYSYEGNNLVFSGTVINDGSLTIPEPATATLSLLALAALAARRRRK